MLFRSNLADIKQHKVDLLYPDIKFDYLAPSDIGAVASAVLAEPEFQKPNEGESSSKTIYICGPELLTQEHAYGILAEKLGHEIKVTSVTEDQWRKKLSFMPAPVLDTLIESMRASHEGKQQFSMERYDEAVENIRRYKGAEPMGFGEWVEVNKGLFA